MNVTLQTQIWEFSVYNGKGSRVMHALYSANNFLSSIFHKNLTHTFTMKKKTKIKTIHCDLLRCIYTHLRLKKQIAIKFLELLLRFESWGHLKINYVDGPLSHIFVCQSFWCSCVNGFQRVVSKQKNSFKYLYRYFKWKFWPFSIYVCFIIF